jgi:Zn finger protein HypA/HybF involved in hydrogenase expression
MLKDTRPTIPCPCCTTRMSPKQSVNSGKATYHCPMCDAETKRDVLHTLPSLRPQHIVA